MPLSGRVDETPVDGVERQASIAATVPSMLVTAREAAEILDVKVHSVYMMASRGRLACLIPREASDPRGASSPRRAQ